MSLRSWLFIPGDSDKKLSKGADSGADVLIIDLEDAVADARKPVGREMTCEYLQQSARKNQQLWVRINPLDTPHALHDLAGIIQGRPDGLILPKAESVDDSYQLGHYLDALETEHGIERGNTKILALITETPGALLTLEGYRRADPRVTAVSWGAEDLSAAVGASSNRDSHGKLTEPYVLARSMCLMTAHAAGVQPVDTVYPDFRDDQGLQTNCNEARRDGYTGKIAIHPNQVPIINLAFTPSDEEIAHAKAVIKLFEDNPEAGALSLDGKMLDKPHLTQARRVVATAERLK